jgi:hypothetical protein
MGGLALLLLFQKFILNRDGFFLRLLIFSIPTVTILFPFPSILPSPVGV